MILTAALDKNGIRVEQTAEAPLHYCIDSPASAQTNLRQPGTIAITGWAASSNQSEITITATFSDGRMLSMNPRLLRPDVVDHFLAQGSECSEQCGFAFELEIKSLSELPLGLSIVVSNDVAISEPCELTIAPSLSEQHDNHEPRSSSTAANAPLNANNRSQAEIMATTDDAASAASGHAEHGQLPAEVNEARDNAAASLDFSPLRNSGIVEWGSPLPKSHQRTIIVLGGAFPFYR